MKTSAKKKIWIDLDNSPHVPFFKPIIEELNKQGYPILLTARDCFQVCGLLDMNGFNYTRVGRHYGKHTTLKVMGLLIRSAQMVPSVLREKPDLGLSHGSRSQILLSSIFKIPSIVISDYEYAKAFPKPTWAILPEVIPKTDVTFFKKGIFKYCGIKEDVYVPNFVPDPAIKDALGINDKDLLITVRPPATEAHYHNFRSEDLFRTVIDYIGPIQNTCMVVLPRNEKQAEAIKRHWPQWCSNGKMIIPKEVVDGLNLIWHSDLVISGGGTMNREAAALGVPVYSIFRGKIGAVDRYLSEKGRLILIENKDQIYSKIVLIRRNKSFKPAGSDNFALQKIVSHIVNIIESQYA
jgi:predicted glycosyltransferase